MTYFIKLENNQPIGSPITEENFRQLFANISFPAYFVAEAVEPLGYGIFDFSNQPTPAWNEKVVEALPVKNEYGIWRQAWAVAGLTEEEMTQRNAAQAAQVRVERNAKLTASDWTQVADAPVDQAAWAAYRQALRDISGQAEFPWNVQWPIMPA